MLKREYDIFKHQDNTINLVVGFFDPYYDILPDFFYTEVHDFYPHVKKALEKVIFGEMEEYAFDGNMLGIEIGKEKTEVYFQFEEEILGGPCFISTKELYQLVLEWKEMEDRMRKGEDIFPLTLGD